MNHDATALLMRGLENSDIEVTLQSSSPTSIARGCAVHSPEASLRLSTDDDLLVRVSEGDREALTSLFRRHAHAVQSVARRILRDDAEAEDLLQEVFLYVYEKARYFDPGKGAALSWIVQAAYHRAIDRRRYLDHRGHYDAPEFQEETQSPVIGQTTMSEIACRELLVKFQSELSAEQRETLELHFFEGYTFHEIAEKTGQTLGNIRHRYYRGIEKLRSFVITRKRD